MMFTPATRLRGTGDGAEGGAELIHIPGRSSPARAIMIAGVMRSKTGMGGQLAWPALLRKLDQQNPGYRQ